MLNHFLSLLPCLLTVNTLNSQTHTQCIHIVLACREEPEHSQGQHCYTHGKISILHHTIIVYFFYNKLNYSPYSSCPCQRMFIKCHVVREVNLYECIRPFSLCYKGKYKVSSWASTVCFKGFDLPSDPGLCAGKSHLNQSMKTWFPFSFGGDWSEKPFDSSSGAAPAWGLESNIHCLCWGVHSSQLSIQQNANKIQNMKQNVIQSGELSERSRASFIHTSSKQQQSVICHRLH